MSCSRGSASQVERREAAAEAAPATPAAAPTATPTPAPRADLEERFVEVAKAIRPALVSVRSGGPVRQDALETSLSGTPFEPFLRGLPVARPKPDTRSEGCGVVIDDAGNILTSNYVVEGATSVRAEFIDGREFSARVIGTDARTGLAVVKLSNAENYEVRPAPLGDSDKLQLGAWVLSFGTQPGPRESVYAGIVNAVGRGSSGIAEYEDFIQTDAAIHPSTVGGPLVNRAGQVVGITAAASESGSDKGRVGFAVPINMARAVADQLLSRGKVVRGSIGVYVGTVTDELAHSFGYRGTGGALVQDVTSEGPGARAGIKAGDIVLQHDGQPVASAAEFRNAIASLAPRTTTQVRVFREGKQRTLDVQIDELPAIATTADAAPAEQPRWGMELDDITPELRSRLNLGAAQRGAIVVQVNPNTPAEDAGLRAGDLVASVGEHEVEDADHARRLLLIAKASVRLRIVHDGRGSFVILNDSI